MVKFTKNARANYAFLLKEVFFLRKCFALLDRLLQFNKSLSLNFRSFGIGDGPNT